MTEGQDDQYMSRQEALEKLRAGKSREWNEYRRKNPRWVPDLSDKDDPADLQGVELGYEHPTRGWQGIELKHAKLAFANLAGASLKRASLNPANLNAAILTGADLTAASLGDAQLTGTDLTGAILDAANLHGASLSRADLCRAHLLGARLGGTRLEYANLSGACLDTADLSGAMIMGADLTGADLARAIFRGAHLDWADLSDANLFSIDLGDAHVIRVKYHRKKLRRKCQGARVSECYGNALFKRDVQDQDFIDTLEEKWKGTWRIALLRMWSWIDYGRGLVRVAIGALVLAVIFGVIFATFPGMLVFENPAPTWFTPYYYSIVAYTTLGFGDVTPITLGGEILVTVEVVFGYVTLGLLVSILAQKVARRS